MIQNVVIGPKQSHWWSERCRAQEREGQQEKKAGQVAMCESVDALLADLHE